MIVSQSVQRRPWPALRCEYPRDRLEAERAVAHGPLQRTEDVRGGVDSRQRQDSLRLVLAETASLEQAFQEPRSHRTELPEALAQVLRAPLSVAGRLVVRTSAALTGCSSGEESVPHSLDERPVMDDQLVLAYPHRDRLADEPPWRRIEVLAVDHESLGVDGAIDNLGGIERPRR